MLTHRPAARVVLTDDNGRVLLFEGHDPARPQESFWWTIGGGVEPGEELRAAAVREVFEETGLRLDPADLVGPIWKRQTVFSFDGLDYAVEEWFFLADSTGHDGAGLVVDTSGFNDIEKQIVHRHHWWSVDDLCGTEETIYPVQLGEMLPDLLGSAWDGTTRAVR